MIQTMQQDMIREAVGVFDNPAQLDAAIAELEVTAFSRQDISVLGNSRDIEQKFGVQSVKTEWLEDDPKSPRGISVRPEEKTIGAGVLIGACAYIAGCIAAIAYKSASTGFLLLAIAGGSLGGALIGGIIVLVIGYKIRSDVDERIRQGGLLLWVRTTGPDKEQTAQSILRKHGARHVHVHSIT